MKLNLVIHAYNISLYISRVSYSGLIISLVAMATLSYHRLKMGKVEIEKLLNLTGRH